MSAESPSGDEKVHECVHDRNDPSAIAEPKYGMMGAFSHSIGMSSIPIRVDFRCRCCGRVFDTTTDRKIRKQHIG